MFDKTSSKIRGEWRDIEYFSDGKIITGEWEPNIIVHNINILIAGLFHNQFGLRGLTHWAIGEGNPEWDEVQRVELNPFATKLVSEIGRKPLRRLVFINDINATSDGLTNRLLVSTIIETDECIGTWREFAIFGGNANMTPDSGIMINHKAHARYIKTTDVTVERQIRFIL